SSPHRLTSLEASRPLFGPDGEIVFLRREGDSQYVYRAREDGNLSERVVPDPVIYLIALSPDGQWVVVWIPYGGDQSTQALAAYPTRGGPRRIICTACAISGPYNPGAPMMSWTRDQRALYFRSILSGMEHKTFVIALGGGEAWPPLPPSGFGSHRDLRAAGGTQEIEEEDAFPGPSPSVYAFTRKTTRRNLYSIAVP